VRTTIKVCAAVAAALVLGAFGVASPASAADPDGGASASALQDRLEKASRGYLDAKNRLAASQQRQQDLAKQLTTAQLQLMQRTAEVADLAASVYRTGPVATFSSLLESDSPQIFVDRVVMLDAIGIQQDRVVSNLSSARDNTAAAKAAVDGEILEQQKQLAEMAKAKRDAEKALASVGGGAASGFGSSGAVATAAHRNSDGSWPPESCSVNDPTTSGCITPRLLHALQQAKAAGFNHYVSCYRSGGSGEHPKGRACDFAAAKSGFGGTATGADRTYGNNLAAYFLKNADRLAVLYVIWFRQIWLPATGWRAYSGGGDPASDHTNHVHLSVY
jgi:peptidoglycan DL-endopeptidase CwlO